MAETPIRDRKTRQTRARIAEAALELLANQGHAETTIDQIAEVAGVGRRTVFRHFATKEAMLFDHLVVRRDFAIRRLYERPLSEPALVSLHAVLRQPCEQGYERRLLDQIRAVLAMDPRFAGEQLSVGHREFERKLIATLENRVGKRKSSLAIREGSTPSTRSRRGASSLRRLVPGDRGAGSTLGERTVLGRALERKRNSVRNSHRWLAALPYQENYIINAATMIRWAMTLPALPP